MNQDLYKKGEINIALENGKLVLFLDTKGADVRVDVDPDYFLDKLAEAIPGDIDDQVFMLLKAALKM